MTLQQCCLVCAVMLACAWPVPYPLVAWMHQRVGHMQMALAAAAEHTPGRRAWKHSRDSEWLTHSASHRVAIGGSAKRSKDLGATLRTTSCRGRPRQPAE